MSTPPGWVPNFPAPEEGHEYTGNPNSYGNPAGFVPQAGSVKVMTMDTGQLLKLMGPQDER